METEFSEEKKFNEAFQNDSPKTGGMTNWLINKKIVKDGKGAKTIMLIITIICFALAIYFFLK